MGFRIAATDEIGLLSPQRENGYRYYSGDLSLLQMILFYKHLGCSLKKSGLLKEEDSEVLYLRRRWI